MLAVPLPDANGYISPADADTWFAGSFGNTQWLALTPAEKQVAISEASRALETVPWWGERCSTTQQWQWPRKVAAAGTCAEAVCTTVPADLTAAVCQLALSLHISKAALVPALGGSSTTNSTATQTTGAVKRQKLGDLEQEFFAPAHATASGSSSGGASGLPAVLAQFPWLRDQLRCWMVPPATSGAQVLLRGEGACGSGCHRLDNLPFPMPMAVGISDSSRMLPTTTGMWGDYVDTTGA